MLKFALFLLIVWAVAAVLGFIIKGLMWLAYVALVLIVATLIWIFVMAKIE